MATLLRCGDWNCSRTNVEVFLDDRTFTEKQAKGSKPEATLKNLRCNVHAGALKRAKYRNNDLLPLTDKDRERLGKEQAVINAKESKERDEAAAASSQRFEQRRQDAWAVLETPAHHSLAEDVDRSISAQGEPRFEGQVWLDGTSEASWDRRMFQLEPVERFYRALREGEKPWPYIVRITSGRSMTPAEAREFAACLVEAADKAEELNATRKPQS